MSDIEFRRALPVDAELGEGLHWDARRQVLWMTDILGRRVIRWDLQSPSWHEWPMPHAVGWVIPGADGDAVMLGLQPGIPKAVLGAPGTEPALDWVARPFADATTLRLNDAKADATGALWVGSMNGEDSSRSEGCLFRLGPDGQLSVHDHGYSDANGPAISPDGRTLLHTASGRRMIYAFDLDAAAGTLANKRDWKRMVPDEGHRDGMSFHAQDRLWVAHWAAGCVSCFERDGRLARRVVLRPPLVTSVCFAGAALDRLFVSTTRVGLSSDEQAQAPLSGHLFEAAIPAATGLLGRPCTTS